MPKKKHKIIYFIEDLGVGGIERTIAHLMMNMDPLRFSCEVWCLSGGGIIADQLKESGFAVRVLDVRSCYDPRNFFQLAKMIREASPDIVHTQTYFSGVVGRCAAKLAGVRVIVSHVNNVYKHYSWLNLTVEKALSMFTDSIICCSNAVKAFVVEKENISPQKTVVIYNGVDPAQFNSFVDRKAIRTSFGVEDEEVLLITAASLTPKKGHVYILEALEKIVRDNCAVKYLVVGDGPSRKDLGSAVKRLGLDDHVIFCGQRQDVPQLLQASDIFVLPSITEGFPLVLVEAFYGGLVVVASDVGGVSELVRDGVDGILVPPEKVYPLQQAVLSLLDDRARFERLQENVIKKDMTDYFTENMVRRVSDLYEELIKRKIQ